MSNQRVAASKIRVLVVDDSAFVRRAIIRMFENSPDISIVDVASDGVMAIELIKKLKPDVVTLDVQMPVLDGLSALERIMKECPVPVVMLSSLTGRGGTRHSGRSIWGRLILSTKVPRAARWSSATCSRN